MIADPDRVAIAGDWHGNTDWAGRMVSLADDHGVRVILHLGDFGVWPGWTGDDYLDRLDAELDIFDQQIFFIDGNHEWFDRLLSLPLDDRGLRPVRDRIFHIPRGFRWTWHGRRWMGLGGAVSIDKQHRTPGHTWWPEEEITIADLDTAIAGGPVDVMLTHDVPYGVPSLEMDLRIGRDPHRVFARAEQHRRRLREVVEAVTPSELWHGHMHCRYDDQLVLDSGKTVQIHGLSCDATTAEANLAVLTLTSESQT